MRSSDLVLRLCLLALLPLNASCVVMTAVTPPPDLKPVAIGGPEGSTETYVDPDAPSYLGIEEGGNVSLLVRPLVNGIDVGVFVLDTGTTGMTISSGAAEKAGLSPIGTTRLPDGAVTTVFLGETFRLGPLTLRGTKYAGADIPYSKLTFSEPVDGFCGYDLFARTVFELDFPEGRIGFFDPATYELEGAEWQELVLDYNLPHARCSFEGEHSGLFLLDAGYGDSVQFFQHTVEQYDLLAGRRTRGRTILNFGSQTIVRQGKLEWFELGGQRFDDIEAHFSQSPSPLYPGSGATMGIVGMGIMGELKVVFDYGNRRVAFVPKPDASGPQ